MLSVVTPYGASNGSHCGYCDDAGFSCKTATLSATQLSCLFYQKMVDRGWRRSGTYCYKPDMKRTCCPQYAIKLDAREFKPSRSQKKIINRWNRFVLEGDLEDNEPESDPSAATECRRPTRHTKGSANAPFSLILSTHAAECDSASAADALHRFQVTLEPSSYTDEKYDLFRRYQIEVHNDKDNSPNGFTRFLVDSPLRGAAIPYSLHRPEHLPAEYGSYHQMYRLDGKLIAMGVIDILPYCVSSVYFIYDGAWQKFSFGKLSALREVTLVREIHDAGVPEMTSLYMGFYIHSCQKMRYKGEYAPSCLLDPEDYQWHSLQTCLPLLDRFKYACFSNPAHSSETKTRSAQGSAEKVDPDVLREMRIILSGRDHRVVVQPFYTTKLWNDKYFKTKLSEVAGGLGKELSGEVLIYDP